MNNGDEVYLPSSLPRSIYLSSAHVIILIGSWRSHTDVLPYMVYGRRFT